MHRYHTYNFRFQLLRQKIVWAYNIADVCCNGHVQENMLSQIVSLEYKTKAYLGIQNLGCHYKISGCHFDTQNRLKNTALVATITKVRSAKTATHLLHHSQCLAWLTVSGSQTILNATRIWVW